jgi:hypothetical protein
MDDGKPWLTELEDRRRKHLAGLQHLTKEQAITRLAGFLAAAEMAMEYNAETRFAKEQLIYGILMHPDETIKALEQSNVDLKVPDDSTDPFNIALQGHKIQTNKATLRGQKAANALHDKPGGSNEKKAAIRAIWASGKFDKRDVCAEQECGALNMSFSAARKALRNMPKPA